MSTMVIEVLVILALLVLNGVFAMSELAVVRSRKVRLEQRAEEGDAGARAALELAAEPTKFLSSVQVGITLIGVLSGAFGGATIAEKLAERFAQVAALRDYAGALGLAIVVVAITYLSLIIGELVPKRIAMTRPEAIASLMARPVGVVATIFRPLVALLTASTNLVLRLLRVPTSGEPTVTEEEIRALVEEGAETGVVQRAEQEIVERAFRLGDLTVASVMTPRPEMEWIDIEDPPEEIRTELAAGRLAHYVVCEGSVDKVLGVVYVQNLLAKAVAGAPIEIPADLRTMLHKPIFVPDSMPVFRLLEEFRRAREQVAIVLDEYGGVEGLATLDHILDTLVGEYAERAGGEESAIIRRDDGTWLVDGVVPLEELEVRLDLEPLPAEERRGFRTVAGFIITRLGHVPKAGESADWGGVRFEVVDMDGRRIDKVLVARQPPATATPRFGGSTGRGTRGGK